MLLIAAWCCIIVGCSMPTAGSVERSAGTPTEEVSASVSPVSDSALISLQPDAGAQEDSSGSGLQARSAVPTEAVYVLNMNSKKFHYPDCASVDKMSPKNRKDFSGTRDEVIAMGYEPCKNCNP